MKRVDIVASLTLVALALAGIFWAIPKETVAGEPGEVAPADLPKFALWVIVVCGAWQLLTSLRAGSDKQNPLDRFALGFLAAGTLALIAALIGIWKLGYMAGGALCIFAIGAAMRPKGYNWVWLVAVSVALPIGIYILSWHGLRLSLP